MRGEHFSDRFTYRFASMAIVIAIAAVAGGCAAVPQVEYSCDVQPSDRAGALALADRTAGCTDQLLKSIQSSRKSLDGIGDLSKAGAFLGALGAGGAAMFMGHRDLIVGSALFGATSYQLGNLYASTTYDVILDAGLEASQCVDSVAMNMQGAVHAISHRTTVVQKAQASVGAMVQSGQLTPLVAESARAAIDRAVSTLALAESTSASTFTLAPPILATAKTVARTLNTQLRKNAPQPEAFLRASEAILAEAKKVVPASAPSSTVPKDIPSPASPGANDEKARQLIAFLTASTEQLAGSLSAFAGFDPSSCPQKVITAAGEALSAKPASLNLATSVPMNVTIRGGQASYRGGWQGIEPAVAEIEVKQIGGSFRFERKSVLPTPREYVYEVTDQLGKSIEIKIEK